jgi:hypothetical protein
MWARLLVITTIGATVCSVALPAEAKGFEHARITITGQGLGAPIRLHGNGAVAYISGAGLGESKWQVPNIGATLDPHAKLGPAYTAAVNIGCSGRTRVEFRQTLYPYAPGGLQILTPDGATWCFGDDVKAGYWPASDELLQTLFAKGLPATPPGGVQAASTRDRATIAATGGSGPSAPMVALIVLAACLGFGGLILVVRRRSRA